MTRGISPVRTVSSRRRKWYVRFCMLNTNGVESTNTQLKSALRRSGFGDRDLLIKQLLYSTTGGQKNPQGTIKVFQERTFLPYACKPGGQQISQNHYFPKAATDNPSGCLTCTFLFDTLFFISTRFRHPSLLGWSGFSKVSTLQTSYGRPQIRW